MSDFGSDSALIDPQTAHGRDAPLVIQFSLFVENRPGVLRFLLSHLQGIDSRLVAINILETSDSAIIRCVFDNSDRAREAIDHRRIRYIEHELLVVAMPDEDDGLVTVCTALFAAEVNILYAYPLLVRPLGRQAIAMRVDNPEQAAYWLTKCKFGLLDEHSLRTGG